MKSIIFLLVIIWLSGCNSSKTMNNNVITSSPHVFVYKTKGDFYSNVPIILSDNKQEIVSYPHPFDLLVNGKLLLPSKLENGYLLDNKGISVNVAFIKMNYSEYSALSNPPTKIDLKKMIIESDPLIEMYDCGIRYSYKDIEQEVNSIIKTGKLNNYRRIK
jgi:hypothetical protein